MWLRARSMRLLEFITSAQLSCQSPDYFHCGTTMAECERTSAGIPEHSRRQCVWIVESENTTHLGQIVDSRLEESNCVAR